MQQIKKYLESKIWLMIYFPSFFSSSNAKIWIIYWRQTKFISISGHKRLGLMIKDALKVRLKEINFWPEWSSSIFFFSFEYLMVISMEKWNWQTEFKSPLILFHLFHTNTLLEKGINPSCSSFGLNSRVNWVPLPWCGNQCRWKIKLWIQTWGGLFILSILPISVAGST